MSGQHKTLLLDVGNTNIKYAYNETGNKRQLIVHTVDSISDYSIFNEVNLVLISAVSRSKGLNKIIAHCDDQNIQLREVKTEPEALGLRCVYRDHSSFGVDRWLAMLAARYLYKGNFAVLDFGTAATCDVVKSDGEHVGGWIAPGFNTMRKSLVANTDQVQANLSIPNGLSLGTTTEDCVDMGCLAAITGLLSMATKQLQLLGSEHRIFVTGGNRNLLKDTAGEHVEFVDNMVLIGLALYEQ